MKQIICTNGVVAMVDDEDYQWLSIYSWTATKPNRRDKTSYAYTTVNGQRINMSVMVYEGNHGKVPAGLEVDHIDRNGLNNQDFNLRAVTHSQNVANQGLRSDNETGFRGVRTLTGLRKRPYQAFVTKDGVEFTIGEFETPEKAAKERDKAAKSIQGQYAYLNFPE